MVTSAIFAVGRSRPRFFQAAPVRQMAGYRTAMLSFGRAAELAFIGDIEPVASTIAAAVTVTTAVGVGLRAVWSRRRKARAQQLRIGWQVESGPASTGALVINESKVVFEKLVLTVSCGIRGRAVRKDIALLKAGGEHLWSTEDVHRSPDSPLSVADETGRHHQVPHDVQLTFRDGKGYWTREDQQVERVRSLVVWAEKTRAATLRRYFGRRSPFRRTYSVSVTVQSFDRTEQLEAAFKELTATGKAPENYEIPDVVAGPHDWIGRVVEDESIIEPPYAMDDLARVSRVATLALSRAEQLYAVPYVFDSVALIRNDKLAGDAPMPSTFDETVRTGAQLVERHGISGGIPVALQVGAPDELGNAGDPYHMWPLFSSAGGTFFGLQQQRGAGAAHRFADISSWRDAFVAAFVRLSEFGIGENGIGALNPALSRSEALQAFLEGRAPFLVCSSRGLASISAQGMEVTVRAVPAMGDQPATPMVSVYGFYIYRHAPNRPAARDLVTTYLSHPGAGEDLHRLQPLVPVQTQAMSAIAERDKIVRPYVEQCQSGLIMPSWPEMRAAWQLLGQAEYRVLAGDGDPRAVAEAAADAGWELLAEVRGAD